MTAGAVALVGTLALGPVVMLVLRRIDILDEPSHRTSHVMPTLRGGGLAPAVAAVTALLSLSALKGDVLIALLIAISLYALLGMVDDLKTVPALPRLAAQFAIAVVTLPWLVADLRGPLVWQVMFAVGVVVWVPAYVNAFNFMDGINGISAAQVLVAGVTWWSVAAWHGATGLEEASLLIALAALGFLPFNFPSARLFLGDVGSYFFGSWLAVLAVAGLRAGISFEAVFAPLALYLADTATTLVRRIRRQCTWYEPHRDHTYQRLHHGFGWSHFRTTAVVTALMVACSALGASSETSSAAVRVAADIALIAVLAGYLCLPRILASLRSRASGHRERMPVARAVAGTAIDLPASRTDVARTDRPRSVGGSSLRRWS